ncbi:hypothetical protein MferCBS31731_006742 [Microsporum ferrugineum]
MTYNDPSPYLLGINTTYPRSRTLTYRMSPALQVLALSLNGANYNNALDGKPLFVTTFDTIKGETTQITGNVSTKPTQQAIVEGSQYAWESTAISASLLWRTTSDDDDVEGFSGAVLCLGRPSDQNVRAVVSQNFVTLVKK